MVNVLPFNGLRYNTRKIKDISIVLAPPYDVISADQNRHLKNLSDYNITHLTLPYEPGVRNKYEHAKKSLLEWITNDVLLFEDRKGFYIFEESFIEDGKNKNFTGFIGLLKVQDYGAGGILRHEKTLPKPKEDRLKLLTACRTNLEFIYTIYNDDDDGIGNILELQKNKPSIITTSADYDSSLKFRFWSIHDSRVASKITELMKKKAVLIADGHHRYETSRLYREAASKVKHAPGTAARSHKNRPEDYIMTLFVSSNQKDISIHPTHRVIKFNKKINFNEFLKRLSKYFKVEKIKPETAVIEKIMKKSLHKEEKSICICQSPEICYIALLKTGIEKAYRDLDLYEKPFDGEFELLDVNILHKFIITGLLYDYEIIDIRFLHTVDEIFDSFNIRDKGTYFDAGFILNAPEIKTVENLSNRGKIMPQKSTYFYPKPCSGLVMYKFDMHL